MIGNSFEASTATAAAESPAEDDTQGLAWSRAETDEVVPYTGSRSSWRWAVLGVVGVVAAGAAVAFLQRPTPQVPPSTPSMPPAAAPVQHGPIDGTYRVDRYRGDGVTTMPSGKASEPAAPYSTIETEWWAFQSACPSMGCSAVGTRLDNATHTKIAAQLVQNLPENETTQSLRLINGHWISDPPNHVPQDCPAGMPGHDMWRFTMELTQLPDGTLRGQESDLVESNECGGVGMVATTPVVAMRVGDLPAVLPPLKAK